MKHGKKYVEAAKAVDRATLYDTQDAISLAKKSAVAKFDETIEVHIRTGCDGRHADQQIRGAVVLPHGTGKQVRVLVFAKDAKADEATAAGADYVVTQPIFDPKVLADFLNAAGPLGVPVIAGVWPLMNAKNAEFMNNEVPGVSVPEAIIERMRAAKSKEEAHAIGADIAIEIIGEIRHLVQGVQVSAPLGNTKMAIEVIKRSSVG